MNSSGYSLPDKLYFRIGEVSDIVGVKPYVLRYWETEFSDIKPTKSKSGQRLYKKRDVELLLQIKDLLYTERFTINGAKQRLKELAKAGSDNGGRKDQQVVLEEVTEIEPENVKVEYVEKEVEEIDEKESLEDVNIGVGRKFLQKIKFDLEWCLSELRSNN